MTISYATIRKNHCLDKYIDEEDRDVIIDGDIVNRDGDY